MGASSAAADPRSLRELALERVVPRLDELSTLIDGDFGELLPHDPQIKALRGQLLELRTYLDLSAPAFPCPKGKNPFAQLRKELNNGYVALGDYKDLYASQNKGRSKVTYPPGELAKRQAAWQSWRAQLEGVQFAQWAAHLQNAPEAKLAPEHQKQSRFFWGAVDVRPDASLSGLQNLERLTFALAEQVLSRLPRLLSLATPVPVDEQEVFHDFRKSVRALFLTHSLFPEVSSAAQSASLEGVEAVFKRLGKINDNLVALTRAQKQQRPDKEQKILARIDAGWAELRSWAPGVDLPALFQTFTTP